MTEDFFKELFVNAVKYGPAALALMYVLRAGYKQQWRWDREVIVETKRADDAEKRAEKAEERERYWSDLFVQQTTAIKVLNENIRELQTQVKFLSGAKQ